ncbi:hypothetical protein EDD29_5136 [Actinocorallia herbida]|uniref:Anti-sigma regulatory factor (Ser/Thr protein kinase) n=1 Tax=Actinocorallia herbida TaxID=58109 RepID=A0A3N1D398_9ACTN|nr:hypothetical protein [Actinocorallia herbida]ROO87528.1 hypothetical protein EDD29_5136 [Actinocorallia herbida]
MNTASAGSEIGWQSATPPGALRFTFPGVPAQVREARKLVEKLFAGTGREDDAGLIIDELANNSILYTRSGEPGGWFGVELAFGTLVRIGVVDLGGAGWLIGEARPRRDDTRAGDDFAGLDDPDLDGISLGGRGLSIVARLAVTTGACGSDDRGHFVWADLALPSDTERTTTKTLALLVP